METVQSRTLFRGSSRVLPNAYKRSVLPFSVNPLTFDRSIIFSEGGKTHFRGLDGRVQIKSGQPRFEDPSKPLEAGSEKVYVLYPSGKFAEAVIKTSQFKPVPPEKKIKGSGCKFASAMWDGASNISGIFRNIFWIQNPTSPNPGITAGIGYTSAMGIVTGPITVLDSIKALKKAKQIGDVAGSRLAKVGVAKGVLETGSGAVMAGVRTLSLVALSTTTKAVGVASTVFGIASTVGFVAIFAIYAARFSRILSQALPLFMKLRKEERTNEAFCILTSTLSLSMEELEGCGLVALGKSRYEVLKMITEEVKVTEKEAELLTPGDRRFVEDKIPAETEGCENLRARYLKEIARLKMVKEAEYQRTVGGNSLSMLKKYQKQGIVTPVMMEEIVKTAQTDLAKQVVRQTLLLFAVLAGIASFIVTTIFTAGAPLIIGFALMLVMNLILTGADTEGMLRNIQALKKSSKKEKIVMALLIILTIAITAVGAFFTGGGSLLAVALIMGVLMVSVQAGGMIHAWKKDKALLRKEETNIDKDLSLGLGDIFKELSESDDDKSSDGRFSKPVYRQSRLRKRVKRSHSPGVSGRYPSIFNR